MKVYLSQATSSTNPATINRADQRRTIVDTEEVKVEESFQADPPDNQALNLVLLIGFIILAVGIGIYIKNTFFSGGKIAQNKRHPKL